MKYNKYEVIVLIFFRKVQSSTSITVYKMGATVGICPPNCFCV